MPITPAIPGKTLGAGMGNLKNENIRPTAIPVTKASNVSFTLTPLFYFYYFQIRPF